MVTRILEPYISQPKRDLQAAYIDYCIQQARARSENYRVYREYYDGSHDTRFIDRLKTFIGVKGLADLDFSVNYCPLVVQAKSSRLHVKGFQTEDDSKKTYEEWWQKNRMDALEGIVHLCAVRDADTYVLCEWDNEAKMPRYYHELALCGGEGVSVYYSDERKTEVKFASKEWVITYGENIGKERKRYLYFPNRIERYVSNDDVADGYWQPDVPENDLTVFVGNGVHGKAGISWWTDTGLEDGKPLGVPIFHFKDNDSGDRYGTSILSRVIPLQDALNKSEIDIIAAMDVEGFGLLVGYGADWSNIRVGTGAVVSVNKSANDGAKLERLQGTNPVGMLSVKNDIVMDIARITGTPLSYLQTSGQVAAEGTMKQQEVALVSQIKKAQIDFGNVWEDCLYMGRRLHNAFGDGGLSEDTIIETIWADAESRNDLEETNMYATQVEKLGVSKRKAQENLGYSAEEQEEFEREAKANEAKLAREQARLGNQNNATIKAQNNTQTANETGANNGRASP
jgi:hypothetical protein